MRVLMLSWEYPPKSVGGLAQHVYDLTSAMARQGVEVHLITCAAAGAPRYETVNGVNVYRVHPYQVSTPDFPTWVLQFNIAMLEEVIPLTRRYGAFDIIHAHDWLVAYAARALKHALTAPLIATIHATEFGRNNGLHNQLQNYISNVEWWLTYEAWRVIVCSRYMEGEIKYVFQTPADKIAVINNGVDPANFAHRSQRVNRDFYAAPNEKIVFYVGRLVPEKGVQVLIRAMPNILAHCPATKFVIAGKGPYEQELRSLAAHLGLQNRVYFTGYINDEVRNALYHWAEAAVFPSLYEPFGIVALEAMAARTPVVVSDTGGLSEIVEHGVTGLKAYTGDANSLAHNIIHLLTNPSLAKMIQERAFRMVQTQYDWNTIARQTVDVYRQVDRERRNRDWKAAQERQGRILERVQHLIKRSEVGGQR
ncbi:glycosyltransferase family 4 protein [Desulforudis sp. 1088]|uniref:glycosyltransferase family 4 protein n=1 Tax=unclassified Candidatus Desulforudis TaxID=2635950 RepID=UPI003498A8C2